MIMTQEQKELLIKDLCARLPYGVKISVQSWDEREMEYTDRVDVLYSVNGDEYVKSVNEDYDFSLEDIKPYLFPFSSMTEEQKNAAPFESSLLNAFINGYISLFEDEELTIDDLNRLYDWFDKNHFDYRGLIPMGLAIDATNLNIY